VSILEPPDDRLLLPLDDEQVWALSQALRRWADRHPEPHRPLISFGGDRFVSADELAEAVRPFPEREERYPNQGEVRRRYLRMVQLVMLETPFEVYLGSIERSGSPRFLPLRWSLELLDQIKLRRCKQERRPPPPAISAR
jgi:hypothetical protein